jgi:hypothetical protein
MSLPVDYADIELHERGFRAHHVIDVLRCRRADAKQNEKCKKRESLAQG